MPTHQEVAENWIKQTGKKRTGKRMFYNDQTIYSHGLHWPLGRIVNSGGDKVVLLEANSIERSVSTHTHYRIARDIANRSGMTVIDVNAIDQHVSTNWRIIKALDVADEHIQKSNRARKHKAWPLRGAHKVLSNIIRYLCVFDVQPYKDAFCNLRTENISTVDLFAVLKMTYETVEGSKQ